MARRCSTSTESVDHTSKEIEVTLRLAGSGADGQVDAARQDIQTWEWSSRCSSGIISFTLGVLSSTFSSAAVSTTACSGTSLGANAIHSITQVAEQLRKGTGIFLDLALGVTDVSARGCVDHGGQHGNSDEDCEGVHCLTGWASGVDLDSKRSGEVMSLKRDQLLYKCTCKAHQKLMS